MKTENFLKFEIGPCFGRCQAFTFVLFSDEFLFTDNQTGAVHISRIAPSQVQRLLKLFQSLPVGEQFSQANCFDLSDQATVMVDIKWEGEKRHMEYYLGCRSVPSSFQELENAIRDLVGNWI
jgi:hypothetical protein